jgi:hypothetical protein
MCVCVGVAAVATGDFKQLPPVGVQSFPGALTQPIVDAVSKPATVDGCELFKPFVKIELVHNERANNSDGLAAIVNDIRAKNHITEEAFLKVLLPLTAEDVQDDPSWLTAPIITQTNAVRNALNIEAAKRFSRLNNKPLYQ